MECKTSLSLLEPYLDNELDRADARELEAHAAGCAECGASLSRLDELRSALRDQTLRYTAPKDLRDRIRAATDATSARAAWPLTRDWLRLAAVCVLAFSAGGMSLHFLDSRQNTEFTHAQITRDLFASHWRALAAASPVDVVSTDQHTVKPWFAGKVAQAPLVQNFAEQGFPLAGGRIDYVGSERVPVLVYRHGQHLIDVFVLSQVDSTVIGNSTLQQGYALEAVKLGDQSAAIVTDMDQQELARFARLLAAAR